VTAARLVGGLTLLAICVAAAGGCRGGRGAAVAMEITGGDPRQGTAALRQYGCHTCHTIPGVSGADGRVGPSLRGFGTRVYIAGQLPNTPEHLMQWIQDPRALIPGTAMPWTGVSDEDLRHIAAYLYTLH
jgi:cytochrome c